MSYSMSEIGLMFGGSQDLTISPIWAGSLPDVEGFARGAFKLVLKAFKWSGRLDSNQRHPAPAPKAGGPFVAYKSNKRLLINRGYLGLGNPFWLVTRVVQQVGLSLWSCLHFSNFARKLVGADRLSHTHSAPFINLHSFTGAEGFPTHGGDLVCGMFQSLRILPSFVNVSGCERLTNQAMDSISKASSLPVFFRAFDVKQKSVWQIQATGLRKTRTCHKNVSLGICEFSSLSKTPGNIGKTSDHKNHRMNIRACFSHLLDPQSRQEGRRLRHRQWFKDLKVSVLSSVLKISPSINQYKRS